MKNITALLTTFCVLCLAFRASPIRAADPAPAQPPFTMNGWQFHDYNLPKLEDAIHRAPDYNVNFLIFSHGLFRSVEGFLASTDTLDLKNPPAYLKDLYTPEYFTLHPHWISDINHLGNLATQQHIPFYLWVHEFDDIPRKFLKGGDDRWSKMSTQQINRAIENGETITRGRVDMNDSELYAYLITRYEKLLAAVPQTAGFVLTMHECDFKVFRNSDVISSDSVPDRIVKVATLLHDVLKKHNKTLILRNFFYEPLEMQYFAEAVKKLPDDIIIMSKDMTHEFHPFYPFDPLHGQVGNKKQIIEIDLGTEKAWSNHGAYAQTDFIHKVIQHAEQTHLTGLVGRARMSWEKPFEDTHEVNLYAFSRFMQNPTLTTDQVLTDWAAKRYPKDAVPFVVSAMKRTEFINHHGRWHLEYWFTKDIGTEWGNYPYYYGHLLERARSKWTHDPADLALEEKLFHPDQDTYDKLVAEKNEVLKQVRDSQADIEKAAPYLNPGQLAQLREDFRFLQDAAILQQAWIRAYFSMRMYIDNPGDRLESEMESGLADLEKQEKAPGFTYGLNPKTNRRYNIEKFESDMRSKTSNPEKTQSDDAQILEKVRHSVDAAAR